MLETIYREAWEDELSPPSKETGDTLRQRYRSHDDLARAVPELILRHNLHGIDIDPRAAQIAALALWLRAERWYQRLKLKPAERPQISKTNIVCAEPMPGEKHLLQEFTAQLQPPVLRQLVEIIFDKMQLAGEAGSLLQIEKEIADAIAAAKKQWQGVGRVEQLMLFGGSRPAQTQGMLFDISGITEAAFWDEAEGRVFEALRAFALQTTNGRAVQRRLFAEDAARGLAFIDLCRKRYDVALMNPPFGLTTSEAFDDLKSGYKDTYAGPLWLFRRSGSGTEPRRACRRNHLTGVPHDKETRPMARQPIDPLCRVDP